jgi:flagellar biosynthesis protein FlhG
MQTHRSDLTARPLVWAVGGGKGGTGKSLVATSLGIHLAEMGRSVVLVDGDLGAPNLHTFLGLDPPRLSLTDVIRNNVDSLEATALPTGIGRLRIVSGARNSLDVESLKHFQKARLLRMVLGLQADVVVVDLGAGTSLNVLDFFSIADRGLMVILPEPTSVENCYRFLSAAFLRRLQHLGRTLGYQPVVNLVLEHRGRSRPDRPLEILEEIRRIDSVAAERLGEHLEGFLPHLVLNQVRDQEDIRLGETMETVCDRLLGLPIRFAGAVPYDPVLVRTVKCRRPYMTEYPRSRTAEAFRAAAESTAATWPERERTPGPNRRLRPRDAQRSLACEPAVPDAASYRTLGLRPGASHEEIVSAYLRLRPAFRADSRALVSLDCEAERRAALAEIEQAFQTLSRKALPPRAHASLLDVPPPRHRPGWTSPARALN